MSGGGKKSDQAAAAAAAANAAAAADANQSLSGNVMFPVGLPSQMGMLAHQLTRGYGGTVGNNMNYLNSMYAPMNVPLIQNAADMKILAKRTKTGGSKAEPHPDAIDALRWNKG